MTEPLSAAEREGGWPVMRSFYTGHVYSEPAVERILADRLAAREVAHRAEVEAARAETRALREAVEALREDFIERATAITRDDGASYARRVVWDHAAELAGAALAQHAEPDTTPGADQ